MNEVVEPVCAIVPIFSLAEIYHTKILCTLVLLIWDTCLAIVMFVILLPW